MRPNFDIKHIVIVFCFLLSCTGKQKTITKLPTGFEDIPTDNIPEFLEKFHSQSDDYYKNILKATQYDTNSVYIFRNAFRYSDVSCIQLKRTEKPNLFTGVYYEYFVNEFFYDNKSGKYTYANRKKNPTIQKTYFNILINNTLVLLENQIYSKSNTKHSIKNYNRYHNEYQYYIFNGSKFYEIKNDNLNEETDIEKYIGEIMNQLSFKEALFYSIYSFQQTGADEFVLKNRNQPLFYLNDTLKRIIPNEETILFHSGNINQ